MKKFIFYILYLIKFHKILIFIKKITKDNNIISLMFHRIEPEFEGFWPAINKKNFENLLLLLKKNTNIIDIKSINTKVKDNKINIIITFDDGYKDFIQNVIPILKKNNISANMNICPELIEKKILPWTQIINYLLFNKNKNLIKLLIKNNIEVTNIKKLNEKRFNNICLMIHKFNKDKYRKFINDLLMININPIDELMNWQEINKCISSGVTIGNHSANHLNIHQLNRKDLKDEIILSNIKIEKKTEKKIEIFSVPNGKYDNESLEIIKKKYNYILLSEEGRDEIKHSKNCYLINRINISKNDIYEEFFRLLGFHDLIKKLIFFKFFKI